MPQRILLIKPSSLGDIVHALPVLHALRAAFPRAHIAWLVSSGFAPLLDGHPLLDEVIVFDRRRFGRMLQSARILADFVRFVLGLRARRFDLVLDLQGLVRSGFMAWATGARRRLGFADAREFAAMFYSQRVRCGSNVLHAVERNLAVARAATGANVSAGDSPSRAAAPEQGRSPQPAFPLPIRPDAAQSAAAKLAAAAGAPLRRYVALLPGARWESKLWPAQQWALLIDALRMAGHPTPVLLGAFDDRARTDAIVAVCASAPIDLVGRTSLPELVALLAGAACVISQDSGPMHLAAALGRPLVALFGPTDARRTGPYAQDVRIVSVPLDCAPCRRRRCPLGHHACMRELSVESVLAAVAALPGGAAGELLPAASAGCGMGEAKYATDAASSPMDGT